VAAGDKAAASIAEAVRAADIIIITMLPGRVARGNLTPGLPQNGT
jgi:methyl coenzyme M reductase alpha subunit